jgi:CHAT domain-containing protein/tetratricopeptide (TPR) repeat protein
MGDYMNAIPKYIEALQGREKILGKNSFQSAQTMDSLGEVYYDIGDYANSEPLYQQALDIRKKVLDKNSLEVAATISKLAKLYHTLGHYSKARWLCSEALDIRSHKVGKNHPEVAESLNNLAEIDHDLGNYVSAQTGYNRALRLRKEILGKNHPEVAHSLNNLARLYTDIGKYSKAEPLYREALDIWSNSAGENHPEVAEILNNLARLYTDIGKYFNAEPLYRQALDIWRSGLGEKYDRLLFQSRKYHPKVAVVMTNLARLYHDMGDYTKAEPLYQQALDIRKKVLGDHHPDYASSLNNIGEIYHDMGDYTKAEPLYQQALDIRKKVLGDHPKVAVVMTNLASLYHDMGDYTKAEPLYQQALQIRHKRYKILERIFGDHHPDYAATLHNLARLYHDMGDYTKAEPLYREALDIRKKVLGDHHPDYAATLDKLASLHVATHHPYHALVLMKESIAIHDHMIEDNFSISSERQRMAFLKIIENNLHTFLSLVFRYLYDNQEAVNSALDLVLSRKAIGAEALFNQREAFLSVWYPVEARSKVKELRSIRTQIGNLTMAGRDVGESLNSYNYRLDQLNMRKEEIEIEIARQVANVRPDQNIPSSNRHVIVNTLAKYTDALLIEFIRFNEIDFLAIPAHDESRLKPAHYLVFVLSSKESNNVQMIDLGEADVIDKMITTFRNSFIGETRGNDTNNFVSRNLIPYSPFTTQLSNLRTEIFESLILALRDRKRLFIAPDGDLTRLPFEILFASDAKRYLLEDYVISYLSTGRDILRFADTKSSIRHEKEPLIVADPDFDLGFQKFGIVSIPILSTIQQETNKIKSSYSRDLERGNFYFESLKGTAEEGRVIAELLGVKPWMKEKVLESDLKAYASPSILHIATHGFFLPNNREDLDKNITNQEVLSSDTTTTLHRLSMQNFENPMLRSGLALAGANTWLKNKLLSIEAEDGILTAEDVSCMDLIDTDLVVLSACETGLGEIFRGEGVFGLRRAFVIAGAQTLVMSLWKVPDEQTKELMIDFYKHLLSGKPRAEALRYAQLAMKEKYPDPYYWAAFICQGNPGPLPKSFSK